MNLFFRMLPNPKSNKDKYGQQYAGIYVGESDSSEGSNEESNTTPDTSSGSANTRRRTSWSCLGTCLYPSKQDNLSISQTRRISAC